MPKINTPEISKGFFVAIGVALALFMFGLASMLLARFRSKAE